MSSFKRFFVVGIMVPFLLLLVMPTRVVAKELENTLIKNVITDTTVIQPKYDLNDVAITVEFELERPAEVQLVGGVQYYSEIYHGPTVLLQPGVHQLKWHGMDNDGALPRFNEGHFIIIRAIEILDGVRDPDAKMDYYFGVTINNEGYHIPNWRMDELILAVELDNEVLLVSETEDNSVVNGKITVSEEVKVEAAIVNKAGASINYLEVKNQGFGIHTFAWDGTEFDNSNVYNGTYYIKIDITESRRTKGTKIINELPISVSGGLGISLPENPQMVRVTVPTTHINPYPSGIYEVKVGDIFPIFNGWGSPGHDTYNILVEGEVPAIVNVANVELIDLENIPIVYGYPSRDDVVLRDVMVYINNSVFEEIVNKDTPLRILMDEGEWYRVLTPSGKQLYISKSDISLGQIQSTEIVHRVVKGDTLWSISQRYGVTVQSIVNLNQLEVDSYLEIGKEILIQTNYIEDVQDDNIYIVQSGDSLWKIAQKHEVSLEELINLNDIYNLDIIVPGQKVNMPISKTSEVSYIVALGDSLWTISQRYKVSVEDLVTKNNITNPDILLAGQHLVIPISKDIIIHTVRQGDSLWRIAQRYNKNISGIAEANNINDIDYIEVGQKILII